MSQLRGYLHRYWVTFDDPPEATFWQLGCGVTAVDRDDAEKLLRAAWFAADGLPRIRDVLEDVDVRDLDPGHVQPNMGDPSIRGSGTRLGDAAAKEQRMVSLLASPRRLRMGR